VNVVMVGPFGLRPRMTMAVRALPLACALVERGHHVTVLLPPWQNPEDAGRQSEHLGVQVVNIALPARLPGLFHGLTALRLVAQALALRPDVVHLFKPKAYSGLAHWLLARVPGRRPPLVVDADDWEGPGGWNDLGGYSRAQQRFFAWQERWGLTHADAVTVASGTLESLVWALGVPPTRVFYLPNGVAPPCAAQPAAASRSVAGAPTILLYTRFFEFPVARVIELLSRVRQRVPAVRLLVAGQGFFGEERELLAQAQAAGLAQAVEYMGWVEPGGLPGVFARATVAIYPFDDTLINRAKCSVKLLEQLAAGLPVVAEAVGENREMIRHGETGWLVAPGALDAFADGVVRLLEDAPLRERLGRQAARDVRARLGWQRLADTAERAYRHALEARA
jgi:glycosyltransferase involved in cell wall biosynthesis